MKILLLTEHSTNFFDEKIVDTTYEQSKISRGTFTDCDYILLPYSWEYHYERKDFDKLKNIQFLSEILGKKIIGLTFGDFGYIPFDKEAVLLRRGGFASKKLINQFEIPQFFDGDPIQLYYENNLALRSKKEEITIGFCGKINTGILNEIYDTLNLMKIRLYHKFNRFLPYTEYICPISNRLRNNVIRHCEHPAIKCDFVLRKKFKAGLAKLPAEQRKFHKTTLEFYNNIRDTDYTVCMRGVGNYSIRFYQTMSMGRIPVFVNTDCELPFDDIIQWKKIIPWVEYENIEKLPEILMEYHSQFDDEGFKERQRLMRRIWEQHLSPEGFFNTIGDYLKTHVVN